MSVKFPISGRYDNYHPIAIHTANIHGSQNCLTDTDDGNAGPMHCRTIVYHPATVYIPHSHAPPYHPATSGTSLLPIPPPLSQQTLFECNAKIQNHASREYSKAMQNTFTKSQNLSIALISGAHQNNLGKVQNVSTQAHKYAGSDAFPKYSVNTVTSTRFPVHHQYHKQSVGSNFNSPSCHPGHRSGNYSSNQHSQRRNFGVNASLNGQSYSCACSTLLHKPSINYDHSNDRRNSDYSPEKQLFDNLNNRNKNLIHGTVQKSVSNCQNIVNSAQLNHDLGSQGTDAQGTISTVTQSLHSSDVVSSEKPASPPPAPYSPMTRPLPTLSPPSSQIQFYAPAQNRYQHSLPHHTAAGHQHQQQQQATQRRYTVAPPLPAGRKSSEKYSNTGSQNPMLRQPKYKPNGMMQSGTKGTDDTLGGAGDAPPGVGRMPITPPGTPRSHPGHTGAEQNQMSDACHQMQALSL